jgi:hypothetical protein
VGVLIYTYDRTDDARISQEIIRTRWAESGHFRAIHITHAFNGREEWYPAAHAEDELLRLENSGHAQGAAELIDAGMASFLSRPSSIEYVLVLAAGTWLLDPGYVASVLGRMRTGALRLATCAWGSRRQGDIFEVGMAVDFFIVDLPWARESGMFPIDFAGFSERYNDLLLYDRGRNVKLEKLLLARFLGAIRDEPTGDRALRRMALERIYSLADREPVHADDRRGHWVRRHYWAKMGLTTHHDPEQKRSILQKLGGAGASTEQLLSSADMTYYNGGRARSS